MDMYQHDGATMFRFVLRGELRGDWVAELGHAWTTAQSILGTKELVIDISGITSADASGLKLLSRMRESGARLAAPRPPASVDFVRSMGVTVAAPVQNRAHSLLTFWRACKRAVFLTGRDPIIRQER